MQKVIENGVTILKAEDGMMLTDNSSFGSTVRLGKEDDGAMWCEITAEEAKARQTVDLEDMATDEDYQSALREMGVRV